MAMSSLLSFHKFSASNGLLRVIILILEVIILGLGTGSFRSNAPETYFVTVVTLSFAVAIMGLLLSLADKPFAHSKAAKNMDYLSHVYVAWLLFNASLAKLVCTNHRNKSDSVAAVRILSGVFGLMNAGLFCWLAYLTAAEKQGFPCRFSTEVNAFEEEDMKTVSRTNAKPLFKTTTDKFGSWSWERSCSKKGFRERLDWPVIFDGGIMQARLYSLVLIILNLIFLSCSYNGMSRSEEYFLSVVCINVAATVLLHVVYLVGLSSFVDNDLRILDKSFHICASVFLFIGANLMLASTIRPVGLTSLDLVPERTLSATLGIVGSFLYGYIGLKQTSLESINVDINNDQTELLAHHLGVPENGLTEHEKLKAKQARVLRQIRPALIFENAGKV